ncbi:MAG: DNA replication/repair protein RecF [Haliscomenobacteraceae bacterium CHB4]|nr:DNA replication and repair protein RecF [Saprospiraceae bacterium]MCE7922425.1 DNA replication/repair protein RecF [Haliscomenobacteraceae bacterium CHB4]
MYLSSLKLFNFKNYEQLALTFSPRLNCFSGLNGMGKTNVLDAVHFLCLCKSHTGLNDKYLVRHGASFFRLEGAFRRTTGEQAEQPGANNQQPTTRIVAKYPLGQRKEIERDGAPFNRLTDYIGQFPVVMIAPDDVALVQDGSEDRRRFLDATLSQISPGYLQSLLTYNALLKQRNALLKKFAEEKTFDAALLESIDRQMPAPAQALFEQRRQFTEAFQPLFRELYTAISAGREAVDVRYDADMEEYGLAALLQNNLEKDRLLQRTTTGPHRDDWALSMDGQPVKKFASQGQLKSFLLALRLAQYEVLRAEKGFAPILLLDDIFDKLDEQRVRQLVGLLIGRDFGQIFITDTQRGRMEAIVASFTGDYKIFEIENGRAKKEND